MAVLGATEAALQPYHLQGLLKLKVSACWRDDELYRHNSDKPAVIWRRGPGDIYGDELRCRSLAVTSENRIPAVLVTVSMLIQAHLACAFFFSLSLSYLFALLFLPALPRASCCLITFENYPEKARRDPPGLL